ncbi:hypothetical protein DPEC_G00371430 [Dallia pectoralis]|nr:hypothetical protein DPEC_G00371430 [Dallia pectoralis]
MIEGVAVWVGIIGLLLGCVTTAPTNKNRDWDIYSFHINSTVTNHYATTVITSRVANRIDQSQEIEFHVKIPKNAFISKFKMTIEGQTYDGVVKPKEEAQQQYTQAVSRGQSAGLVRPEKPGIEEDDGREWKDVPVARPETAANRGQHNWYHGPSTCCLRGGQGTTIKLKIQDKEVDVSRVSAVDLNVRSAPTVICWLMSLESALQGS